MYRIPLISLIWNLFIHINYVKIAWAETISVHIWDYSKFENLKLFIYFLSKDISFNILFICFKFSVCIDKGHLEGFLRFVYVGLSFHFIKSRKLSFKKNHKMFLVFCHKLKRHSPPENNVMNYCVKYR